MSGGVDEGFFSVDGLPMLTINIFLFNLVVSSLLLITLPGLVFFALPAIILLIKGVMWGILLNQLPTSLFLLAIPVFMFEGEGYVIASIAGINMGLSWLKPRWTYEGSLSRREALKKALMDCVCLYFFVIILILAAAIIEAVIITTQ